mgnify:CR=1 FL=1
MPIKIPSGLPARDILDSERIFALEKPEAERQRVRPLKLVILNLMPKKIETETQLLRLISKSPLQVEIDFMKTSTHEGTHVSADHLVKFYETIEAFQDNYYDGFVVTGALLSILISNRSIIGMSSSRFLTGFRACVLHYVFVLGRDGRAQLSL